MISEEFKADFYRFNGEKYNWKKFFVYFIKYHEIRFLYFYRNKNKLNIFLNKFLKRKYGLEINSPFIGKGLYIGHPYMITVNPKVIIGKNCNIHKGVTIGQERRGKRKGTPIIGDNVWIGINSTIVGKIQIGNNVLIAPNSYVNCDVHSNSIVFGNPCIIKENRENATQDYINNIV